MNSDMTYENISNKLKMGILMERIAEASADEPRAGTVFSIVLSMISMAVLAICMSKSIHPIEKAARFARY
ncbi:hypothetical protein BPAE_0145g00150 [Botrytis paeoniae]|uniref:Uncharacterized protein n=1 Tax=Botrytis paeoniae TaxID=278948 RepID=A0A4Z1FEM9_9HELO|nr:hypothetical protein BPAE_0145g00150 [Botrytis paeoniae]